MAQSRKISFSLFCKSIESFVFDNRNLLYLPVDNSKESVCREVKGAIFSLTTPQQVKSPKLVAVSKSSLELLGLKVDNDFKTLINNSIFIDYFCGNQIIPGSQPAAHCYCGYQFGYFAGQLGDGAAMYLGEVINQETGQRWELQLKGAGPTPYSRMADGRKVLRSSIREFLASEAMNYLGNLFFLYIFLRFPSLSSCSQ